VVGKRISYTNSDVSQDFIALAGKWKEGYGICLQA